MPHVLQHHDKRLERTVLGAAFAVLAGFLTLAWSILKKEPPRPAK